jgi:hypothetical protein
VALPVVTLAVGVATYFVRSWARDAYARGELWRRMFFLSDSLGYEPSASELGTLLLEQDASGRNRERKPAGPYYASSREKSNERLLENLAESAYLTTDLAKTMASVCTAAIFVALAFFAVVTVGLLASPSLTVADDSWLSSLGPRVASASSALLAFFAFGVLAELRSDYSSLARTSHHVFSRALELVSAEPSPAAVMSLLGSYDTALASVGAPVPTWLADHRMRELNARWTRIMEQHARGNSGD